MEKTYLTVRELRHLLFNVQNQDALVVLDPDDFSSDEQYVTVNGDCETVATDEGDEEDEIGPVSMPDGSEYTGPVFVLTCS
jgi:hypothetical protein